MINKLIIKTILTATLLLPSLHAIEGKKMTVYKSPSCGCCTAWVDIMEKKGFEVRTIKTDNMQAIKEKAGIKPENQSCHTGFVDGYFIEGHVDYTAVKRLLEEKPKNIAGLSVPGMPVGSPGMEYKDIKHKYNVISIQKDGKIEVYEKH